MRIFVFNSGLLDTGTLSRGRSSSWRSDFTRGPFFLPARRRYGARPKVTVYDFIAIILCRRSALQKQTRDTAGRTRAAACRSFCAARHRRGIVLVVTRRFSHEFARLPDHILLTRTVAIKIRKKTKLIARWSCNLLSL